MKELSIEQKAKRYDEAIKRARAINDGKDVDVEAGTIVCEYIFPELKGEDERIRRMLIDQMERWHEAALENNVVQDIKDSADAITWLEKQGNSNTNIILKKAGIKPAYMDGNAWCVLYGDNIQDGICGFGDTKEEALVEFLKELLEKQGNSVKECLNLPHFTFDDVLALQCCMETVKKVQEDKELYEALSLLHGKVYDAYHLEKKTR